MEITKINIVDFVELYAEKVSDIITRNLLEINIDDYSQEKIEELVLEFTPPKIIDYSRERKIFVAIINDNPVGTLSVANSWDGKVDSYIFLTIFVLPEYHKKGIGRKLIENGENYVGRINGKNIGIPSSITSHVFYNKLGYKYIHSNIEPNEYGCIGMTKSL